MPAIEGDLLIVPIGGSKPGPRPLDFREVKGNGAGIVAFKVYADRQWYVGVDGGNVAVYQGIPTTIIGVHLSHPVRTTRVPASQAERLAPYRNLQGGITAGSRAEANEIVRTICRDLTAERSQGAKGRVRKPRGCP